jgi:Uma2 family endonuclease
MSRAAQKLVSEDRPGETPEGEIPDDCELLDGELVEKETSGEHGSAQANLITRINGAFGRRTGGRWPGGWWFATEVLIDFGPRQKLRPDVSGWRREKMPARPAGAIIRVIPDWVCEILSPSNTSNDTVKKWRVYHQRQVGHYWIIDPIAETLQVHRWHPDGYLEVLAARRGERVRAEPFNAIELPVGVLFGDDDEE